MATNDAPRTTAEVLDRVQIEWAALERTVAGLSEAQLTTPGAEGWAVKDHLAHVGEWERALAAVLGGRPQHEGFRIDAATYAPLDRDIDKLNQVLFERHRDQPISEIRPGARRAHAEVLAALAPLSDADVQRLREKIAGDTYAHYAEHVGWICELLSSLEDVAHR